MGDMGDDFRAMRDARKERHAKWHAANRRLIDASGIAYTDRDEALLFRFEAVRADFYPSTGRWRVPGQDKTYRGGAQAFLAWLRKQLNDLGPVDFGDEPDDGGDGIDEALRDQDEGCR